MNYQWTILSNIRNLEPSERDRKFEKEQRSAFKKSLNRYFVDKQALLKIVGVDHATQQIKDGQRIRVHGTEGYVEIF